MKKLIIFIIIFSLLITFISCSEISPGSSASFSAASAAIPSLSTNVVAANTVLNIIPSTPGNSSVSSPTPNRTQIEISKQKPIIDRVDNITPMDQLIIRTIKRETILSIENKNNYKKNIYAEDVDNLIGIECLRENNGVYYSVHKMDNGKYLYLFYEKDSGKLVLSCIKDRTTEYLKSDFDFIKIGVTTYGEIKQFDPNIQSGPMSGLFTTMHNMFTGIPLIITYSDIINGPNDSRVVTDMNFDGGVLSGIDYYFYILPGDIR
jgi:hypothetical protein